MRYALLILAVLIGAPEVRAQGQAAPMSWNDEVAASLRASTTRVAHSFILVVPRITATALIVCTFWAVASLVRWVTRRIGRAVPHPTLRHLGVQIPYIVVWAIGAVTVLDVLGFDLQTIATGIGLTGIALGFALKDVLSNLISGLLILLMRSFKIGDQIVVGETEGTVEQIDVRVTQIRTYDGRLVLVPNAEIFSSRVINNTASPLRRSSIMVLLDYQQDLALAMDTMAAATRSTRGVAGEPPPLVRLRDLTPEHLVLEARFWADARRADYMHTTCLVRAAIVHALKAAGIALPNPDSRILSPGNVERWRALLDRKAEARLS